MKTSNPISPAKLTIALILAASVVLAQCYVDPDGEACATNQAATCGTGGNNCQQITYSPNTSTYCDSHDDECGQTDCHAQTVPVTAHYVGLTPYIDQFGNCTCDLPKTTDFTTGTALTCVIAMLSGDKCGYCPQ